MIAGLVSLQWPQRARLKQPKGMWAAVGPVALKEREWGAVCGKHDTPFHVVHPTSVVLAVLQLIV